MRFEQFLRRSADRFPDKTALVASGKRLTYSQLDNLSDELAQGLVERGIGRGDRVVLFLDNSAEAVVMKGYWENPEATARALRPGPHEWERVLHTGDLFRTDPDGFRYFVGRKDDIIKSRGEKVAPKEVENVIYALPGVAEVAVVGVPDAILGHAIKAVVAAEPGVTLEAVEVVRHCARFLEDYMVPKFVEFRPSLPKTDSGKISRRLVAETQAEKFQ